MKNIIRLFSYFLPVRLKNYSSVINGSLEINLVDGKKVLDTEVSNYSYGSLQKILRRGLLEIKLNGIQNILLLGLGGGSVIQTLREELDCKAAITAVDIDPEIIRIAKDDFNINRFSNVVIIQMDAAEYIASSAEMFDLIIVDIFIGKSVPEIFTKSAFTENLASALNRNGQVIYNVMKETMPSESLNNIKKSFLQNALNVKIIQNVDRTNSLIIAKKL
jgi:spermidine synthase